MKNQNLFHRIVSKNKKGVIFSIILVCIIIVALPLGVSVTYPCLQNKMRNIVSIDSLLSYYATVISFMCTFFISVISLYQTKNNYDLQAVLENERQRNEVFPDLYILVSDVGDEEHLIIRNYSKNVANTLYVVMKVKGEEYEYKFELLEPNGNITVDQDLDEYPEQIYIAYCDLLGNCIYRSFKSNENFYSVIETGYEL